MADHVHGGVGNPNAAPDPYGPALQRARAQAGRKTKTKRKEERQAPGNRPESAADGEPVGVSMRCTYSIDPDLQNANLSLENALRDPSRLDQTQGVGLSQRSDPRERGVSIMAPPHPNPRVDPDRLDAALRALWAGDPGPLAAIELEMEPASPPISSLLALLSPCRTEGQPNR